MLSAKDALLSELIAVLIDSCTFFVGLSSDISVRGAKYLPQGKAGRGAAGGKDSAPVPVLTMDKQYAATLSQELLPHILVCFEHIFVCQAASAVKTESLETGSKGRGKSVALKVTNLNSARGSMGPISFTALSTCWSLFRGADLIPSEKMPIQPIRPIMQNTELKSNTEADSTPLSSIEKENSHGIPLESPLNDIHANSVDDVSVNTTSLEGDSIQGLLDRDSGSH